MIFSESLQVQKPNRPQRGTSIRFCSSQPATNMAQHASLEDYFSTFRKNIIGNNQLFHSPFGTKEIIYADWTATGRAYRPIEESLQNDILPFLANTHTTTTVTGTLMSSAYAAARRIVKEHVHANPEDVLIFCGSGMTAAVNKLQRILGLRVPERIADYIRKKKADVIEMSEVLRPIVFVTHMEHHSNHTSWLETIATVEIIHPAPDGSVDLEHFEFLLEKYRKRKNKIAAVTACSNVTGIKTPYQEIAKMIHASGGLCFVDFACSAPYVDIVMHPPEEAAALDAVYFSPHKFLGGPGTSGVLIFNKKIYTNKVPDQPGGGTLVYTNPWRIHEYSSDIETREDGGTPPFLQAIKTAMCIRLKEQMGVARILKREAEIMDIIFARLSTIKNVELFESKYTNRLGVISFLFKNAHHHLVVKILNDRFGIQLRGGCSCAGTYGHYLLGVDRTGSHEILTNIRAGELNCKPGWIRLSVHPTMTTAEINFIMDAVEQTSMHIEEWGAAYAYDASTDAYFYKGFSGGEDAKIEGWFSFSR